MNIDNMSLLRVRKFADEYSSHSLEVIRHVMEIERWYVPSSVNKMKKRGVFYEKDNSICYCLILL